MKRRMQGALGASLVVAGLAGLLSTGPWVAVAGPRSSPVSDHEVMHRMMDAMHGADTSSRMHRIAGAEAKMDRCTKMMESMDRMTGTMERMMDSGVMGGG